MSRKQREREREQQRKERKRQRAEVAQPSPAAPDQPGGAAPGPEIAQVAAEIASQLGEAEAMPRAQIERAVQYLGVATALAWLQETLEIEAQGGIWLPDGSRRKTPGGVYFKLIQRRVPKTHVLSIFYPEYEQVFPLDEQELAERLASAAGWPLAAAQRMSFSIIGRPAAIAPPDAPAQAPYVVFDLATDVERAPALAKGLPPITAPPTYRVLAPTHQWPQVAAKLAEHPDAQVIVSGYPSLDPRSPGAIVVHASSVWVRGHAAPRGAKSAPAAQPPARVTGIVKWFNAEKGYGFITTDERGDVFVHQTALAEGRAALAAGERVYLGVRDGRKGPEAVDVHVGTAPPPPGPALPTLTLPHPAIPARSKLKLVARPPEVAYLGRPNQPPSLIAFRVEAAAPPLPAGLPSPAGATTFAVLISLKYWKRVRDALGADPQDPLLVNGYCTIDQRTPGMILVRATLVDTAAQYQRRRAADARTTAGQMAASEQGDVKHET